MRVTGGSLEDLIKTVAGLSKEEQNKQRDHYQITKELSYFIPLEGCKFKVGDWVTPKETSRIKSPGEPCKVISAFDVGQYQFTEKGSPLVPYNMIVARPCFACDDLSDIKLYIADSNDYEPYKGLIYGDGGETL